MDELIEKLAREVADKTDAKVTVEVKGGTAKAEIRGSEVGLIGAYGVFVKGVLGCAKDEHDKERLYHIMKVVLKTSKDGDF